MLNISYLYIVLLVIHHRLKMLRVLTAVRIMHELVIVNQVRAPAANTMQAQKIVLSSAPISAIHDAADSSASETAEGHP